MADADPVEMLPNFSILSFGDEDSPTTGILVSEIASWEPWRDNDEKLLGTTVYLKRGRVIFVDVEPETFGHSYVEITRQMADAYWQMTGQI